MTNQNFLERLLATERHLQHYVAHEMQNAVGAMSLYLDMLSEDISDPDLRDRIDKLRRAADLNADLIEALRYLFPRTDGTPLPLPPDQVVAVLRTLFGTIGESIRLCDKSDTSLVLAGEPALLFDTLYRAINFMLGHQANLQFCLDIVRLGREARITLHPIPAVDVLGLSSAIEPIPNADMSFPPAAQGGGIVFSWPLAK